MKSIIIANVVCFLLLSGCVSQNELTSLDTRISELEFRNAEVRKNSQLLKSGLENREGEEQALRQQAASLRAKMDTLSGEMRTLTGRIEEIEYQLKRQTQVDAESVTVKEEQIGSLAKTVKSNDDRIYRIEQYLNFEPSKQVPPTEKPAEDLTATAVPAPAGTVAGNRRGLRGRRQQRDRPVLRVHRGQAGSPDRRRSRGRR